MELKRSGSGPDGYGEGSVESIGGGLNDFRGASRKKSLYTGFSMTLLTGALPETTTVMGPLMTAEPLKYVR